MAENVSPAMSLRMGLEIECLLVLRNPPGSSNLGTEQSAIHQHIAEKFNAHMERISSGERMVVERGLRASTTAQAEAENESKKWTVGDDISVRPDDENTTQVPLEITSPIILNDNGVHWKAQVGAVWDFFRGISKIQTNDTCGTHVHISPKEPATWSLGHLKRLSMAIIWFEPAIEVILPKQRRQNIWAKANHKDHPQFKAQTVENILHMINSCETVDALIECMNPQDDRYFGWNFTNLRESAIGTAEFRRPPGVTGRVASLSWMNFTAAFVRAAANVQDPTDLLKNEQSVEGMKAFLRVALPSGVRPRNEFGRIFRNKSGRTVVAPLRPLTQQEQELLQAKKEDKEKRNTMMKKIIMAMRANQ